MKTILQTAKILFACAVLSGCVVPADPNAMVPANSGSGKKFNKSVSLSVSGGQETNPLWTSKVSDNDFATALQNAIQQRGLFSRVFRSGNADYQLDVRLVALKQPIIGLNMTVKAEVEWRLKQMQSGKIIWQKTFDRRFTATVGDAFVGVTRLKLANEGAIRESIQAGLDDLAQLSL